MNVYVVKHKEADDLIVEIVPIDLINDYIEILGYNNIDEFEDAGYFLEVDTVWSL